ncbi:MAG: Lrp/AsnC ligand binding domain-containing protein [Candidatus Nitrosotenuis sp.]|nr:Lrp/AsnC ligand binding domain-containing protein [Candidatus Nitrosotenuis sp.]
MMGIPKSDEQRVAKAFVLITCFEDGVDDTVNEIRKISSVSSIERTDGPYDIIAVIESRSNEDLKKTLTHQIRRIKTIRHTLTLRSSSDAGVN